MARSIATIQQQIINTIQANSTISSLNQNTSNVAIWKLFTWITAVAINLLEQLTDIFTGEVETIASQGITGTGAWLRQQVLNFQFGYIVQFNTTTFSPSYSTIDTTAQVITRCSVTQSANFTVNVKIATGQTGSLAPATTPQLQALTGYLDELGFAGVGFQIINQNPDYLYVAGTVFYNGQYVGSIQTAVIAALNNYMATLSSAENFNGNVDLLQVENAILNVPGVTDVFLSDVWLRPYAVNGAPTTYGDSSETKLKVSSADIFRNTPTVAGYIINEPAPHDFASALTFSVG